MYSISKSEIRENYIQYVQMYPLSYKKIRNKRLRSAKRELEQLLSSNSMLRSTYIITMHLSVCMLYVRSFWKKNQIKGPKLDS